MSDAQWAAPARMSHAFETQPVIKPAGFREYDARWLVDDELNLLGARRVGLALAGMIGKRGLPPDIIVGHDFRSYSLAVKLALVCGLMAGGVRVHDIGLAITPMAYFAQFELGIAAVAMVTASHNNNGWTGIKMGLAPPVTLGPEEMTELKETALGEMDEAHGGGAHIMVDDLLERYVAHLTAHPPFRRPVKIVVACGNGTAGIFAPRILRALGAEIVELDCELDHTFPNFNPNPEDMGMLGALGGKVTASAADLGLAFDGDGDRCGIVDDAGQPIFADKIGLLIARDLAPRHSACQFVVDVKSTALYADDPVLNAHGVTVDYWKTGHSHIKRRIHELGALAGFEKSGHMFFAPPLGHGYDDAMVAAIAVVDMLTGADDRSISAMAAALPQSWISPTLNAHCDDDKKYDVVARITARLLAIKHAGAEFAGQPIRDILTVNGARVTVEDGSWALVRASSNMPELVIVVESMVSRARMHEIFTAIDGMLRAEPDVGRFNQTLD